MNELLREIEDDIRREKFDRLWHRFGRIMVGVSVVVVLATIVVVIMQNQKQNQAMEKTSAYIRGIDRMNIEDYKGAVLLFDELTADKESPYYGLALLQKAKAQTALGDKDSARKTYEQLAAQKTTFGDLAGILSPASSGALIEPDTKSPFYYTQSEWKGWQLLNQGKKDDAVEIFMTLRNEPQAPMSQRSRMNDVVQYLAPQRILAEIKVATLKAQTMNDAAAPVAAEPAVAIDKGPTDE